MSFFGPVKSCLLGLEAAAGPGLECARAPLASGRKDPWKQGLSLQVQRLGMANPFCSSREEFLMGIVQQHSMSDVVQVTFFVPLVGSIIVSWFQNQSHAA